MASFVHISEIGIRAHMKTHSCLIHAVFYTNCPSTHVPSTTLHVDMLLPLLETIVAFGCPCASDMWRYNEKWSADVGPKRLE